MDSEEGRIDGCLASPRTGATGAETGARASGPGTSPAKRGRLPRILIVDDEPMIGTTLRVLLSDEHEVVLAESGKAARDHLEREGFDLILCDLMMPGLNGMELHRWLNASKPVLADRMVFMTGGVFTDEARDFLDVVPNRRIEKPFDTRHLLALIGQELARER